jgi:hypothetical protein
MRAESERPAEMEMCLPISLFSKEKKIAVRWMQFSPDSLLEPFFDQTMERLRRLSLREFETASETLLSLAAGAPPITPAGLVFHISRCGSSLVGNVLKRAANARVLSEAAPIGYLLGPYASTVWPVPYNEWHDSRASLLQAIVNLYGKTDAGRTSKLVIKFVSLALLNLDFIRSVWPSVPILIVVRDPVEVIVSHLQAPGGWMRLKAEPIRAYDTFGVAGTDIIGMSNEEYAARVIGKYCEAAVRAIDSNTVILDYAALNDRTLRKIAGIFNLELPHSDSPELLRIFATHAKDARASIPFHDDRDRKQFAATQQVRAGVAQWAQRSYDALLSRAHS